MHTVPSLVKLALLDKLAITLMSYFLSGSFVANVALCGVTLNNLT